MFTGFLLAYGVVGAYYALAFSLAFVVLEFTILLVVFGLLFFIPLVILFQFFPAAIVLSEHGTIDAYKASYQAVGGAELGSVLGFTALFFILIPLSGLVAPLGLIESDMSTAITAVSASLVVWSIATVAYTLAYAYHITHYRELTSTESQSVEAEQGLGAAAS